MDSDILKPRKPLHPSFQNIPRDQMRQFMQQQFKYFREIPYIEDSHDVAVFVEYFLTLETDYCWSLSFDPSFFARLIYEGFLPISTFCGLGIYVLLPWIDPKRCVLDWHELKVPKKIRKKSKHYSITVNQDFIGVIKGCVIQHGESWLYPPMREILQNVQNQFHCVHTIEMWDNRTGELVAGDVGYTVGSVYTSMTGFRKADTKSVGTIQLLGTAKLLQKLGFAFWDLGMVMDYKLKNLHAHVEKREVFIPRLRKHRDDKVKLLQDEKVNVRELLVWTSKVESPVIS